MDITYPHALSHGRLVRAADVRHRKNDFPEGFECISCGEPMIARTDGELRRPHFAHQTDVTCCSETYLHGLAKLRFRETYLACLDAGEAFELELPHPVCCDARPNSFRPGCLIKSLRGTTSYGTIRHDLTKRYQLVSEETKVGEFRPDILLANRSDPCDRIFIEFCVTHQSTEAKLGSGERIVELQVRSEADLSFIDARLIQAQTANQGFFTASDATVYGFDTTRQKVVPDHCQCELSRFRLFAVFSKSGRSFMYEGTLGEIEAWYRERKSQIQFFRIYYGSIHRSEYSFWNDPEGDTEKKEETFKRAVWNVRQSGQPIKSCLICQHRRKELYDRGTLYCIERRRSFKSNNEAVDCRSFSPRT